MRPPSQSVPNANGTDEGECRARGGTPHPADTTPGAAPGGRGDPALAAGRDDDERARLLTKGAYYNPPALALLQAPLASLDFKASYRLFTVLSLLALAAFLALAWREGRRQLSLRPRAREEETVGCNVTRLPGRWRDDSHQLARPRET